MEPDLRKRPSPLAAAAHWRRWASGVSLRWIVALALMFCIPSFALAQTTTKPEGFYRSAPGQAGETNRMSVWVLGSNKYRVNLTTVYCAYKFSPDCANARFGEIQFEGELKSRRLEYYEEKCSIDVAFKPNVAVVRQTGECPSLPYSIAGGQYFKESEEPQELRP
jgi:hypothetical protein